MTEKPVRVKQNKRVLFYMLNGSARRFASHADRQPKLEGFEKSVGARAQSITESPESIRGLTAALVLLP